MAACSPTLMAPRVTRSLPRVITVPESTVAPTMSSSLFAVMAFSTMTGGESLTLTATTSPRTVRSEAAVGTDANVPTTPATRINKARAMRLFCFLATVTSSLHHAVAHASKRKHYNKFQDLVKEQKPGTHRCVHAAHAANRS